MFSCLSILSILTSLKVVFLTISSSSDSLNFLIATKSQGLRFKLSRKSLTYFIGFFVFGFVDDAVSSFAYNSYDFVFVHINALIIIIIKFKTTHFSNFTLKISSNMLLSLLRLRSNRNGGGIL